MVGAGLVPRSRAMSVATPAAAAEVAVAGSTTVSGRREPAPGLPPYIGLVGSIERPSSVAFCHSGPCPPVAA